MAKHKLKYKLKMYVDELPRRVKFIDALETHGITRATYYRDRAIKLKDESSIPSDRLDIYAALLNRLPDELKNYSVNIKPLAERVMPAEDQQRVKALTGLKGKAA